MKASINKKGFLEIHPESKEEEIIIDKWFHDNEHRISFMTPFGHSDFV